METGKTQILPNKSLKKLLYVNFLSTVQTCDSYYVVKVLSNAKLFFSEQAKSHVVSIQVESLVTQKNAVFKRKKVTVKYIYSNCYNEVIFFVLFQVCYFTCTTVCITVFNLHSYF